MLQHILLFGDNDDMANALNVLVTALQSFLRTNKMAHTYLVQLLDDLETSGVGNPVQLMEVRQDADRHGVRFFKTVHPS